MRLSEMKRGGKIAFNISSAGSRFGSRKLDATIIRRALIVAVLSALVLIAAQPLQGQTETVLYNFTGGSDGGDPQSRLTFDSSGNLYGTTWSGGLGYGAVFELSPNGSGGWNETTIYSFTGGVDGANPDHSHVIFDDEGNLYGTTANGGANGAGIVFELSPLGGTWTETVLYNFAGGAGGANPVNGLLMDPVGNLYGTTSCNGSESSMVFELSPSGTNWTEQVIYNEQDCSYSGLAMDASGNVYGVSWYKLFELSPNGQGGWNPTVIHTFGARQDGILAYGTPDLAGGIWGTTYEGGPLGYGIVYLAYQNGFYERMYYFGKSGKHIDGRYPFGGLVFDPSGIAYGTTAGGGKSGCGTVYHLSCQGYGCFYKEKVLWDLNNACSPQGSLVLDNAGILYGTATGGGASGAGAVFAVNPSPAATTTALTSSPNPSTYGEPVTFTAVVTSSAGSPPDGEIVSFMKNKTVLGTGPLSGGSASFTISTLHVGPTKVTATYGGDLYFAVSKSNVVTQVVEAGK